MSGCSVFSLSPSLSWTSRVPRRTARQHYLDGMRSFGGRIQNNNMFQCSCLAACVGRRAQQWRQLSGKMALGPRTSPNSVEHRAHKTTQAQPQSHMFRPRTHATPADRNEIALAIARKAPSAKKRAAAPATTALQQASMDALLGRRDSVKCKYALPDVLKPDQAGLQRAPSTPHTQMCTCWAHVPRATRQVARGLYFLRGASSRTGQSASHQAATKSALRTRGRAGGRRGDARSRSDSPVRRGAQLASEPRPQCPRDPIRSPIFLLARMSRTSSRGM